MKSFLRLSCVVAGMLLGSAAARAETAYPTHLIKAIIPFGPGSANLNLVLRQQPSDPISGSAPLRASVCDVAPLAAVEPAPPAPTA